MFKVQGLEFRGIRFGYRGMGFGFKGYGLRYRV
jgi:hypothetical protein